MKHRIAANACIALFAAGCAATPAERPETPAATPANGVCALKIGFASYGMGIDGQTFEAVQKLLARDPGAARVTPERWGREGEVNLCVETRGAGDAERLFREVRALFPAKPRGPLSVETANGLKAEAGSLP